MGDFTDAMTSEMIDLVAFLQTTYGVHHRRLSLTRTMRPVWSSS
jgi:hypothetical protein